MRALTSQEQATLETGNHHPVTRVYIEDGNGIMRPMHDLRDGYNFVDDVRFTEDVDAPVMQVQVMLHREVGDLSLSPLHEKSPFNRNRDGEFSPQIAEGRRIWVETPIVGAGMDAQSAYSTQNVRSFAAGAEVDASREIPADLEVAASITDAEDPGHWLRILFGPDILPQTPIYHVLDGVIYHVDWESSPLVITCTDKGGRLQRAFIEDEFETGADDGSVLAEDVIRAIRDAVGFEDEPLMLPDGASGLGIRRYTQQHQHAFPAMDQIRLQRAWLLRYRFDPGSLCYALTFYDPQRGKTTPDLAVGPDRYLGVERLSVGMENQRNRARVPFVDQDGEEQRVQSEDAASIARLREVLFMELGLDAARQIDTEAKALVLAADIVSDTASPKAEMEIPLFYRYDIELADLLRIKANGRHFTSDQDLAVTRVERSTKENRTRVSVRGKPSGGHRVWLQREVREGVSPRATAPRTPQNLTLTTGMEEVAQNPSAFLRATWDDVPDSDLAFYFLRYRRYVNGSPQEWRYVEVPRRNEDGTPLEQQVAPLQTGTTFGVQVAAVNRRNHISSWSAEETIVTAVDTEAPETPTGLIVTSHIRGVEASITPNTEADLRGYEWERRLDGGSPTSFAEDDVTERLIRAAANEFVEVRVRSVDTSGNKSDFTSWAGAVAGSSTGVVIVSAADTPEDRQEAADFVCDGTDDHEEINNAIDSLSASGGLVVLSSGTFNIAGAVKPKSDVAIRGEGASTILYMADEFPDSQGILVDEGAPSAEIRALKLDGNKAGQSSPRQGIAILSPDCLLQDLIVEKTQSTGISLSDLGDSADGSTVTNCRVRNCDSTGIVANGSNLTVTSCRVTNNDGNGIQIFFSGATGNRIIGNTCEGNDASGITVTGQWNNIIGNACRDNALGSTVAAGIRVAGSGRDVTVSGNTCEGNEIGIQLSGAADCEVTGNTILRSKEHGIWLGGGASGNNITGNSVTASSQDNHDTYDNIHIGGDVSENNIQGNKARVGGETNRPRWGIHILVSSAENNVVTNNDLLNAGETGAFNDNGTGTVTSAGNRS